MNERLNKIAFVLSHIVLCILIGIEKIFNVNIGLQVYLVTIMVSITSLGNLAVVEIKRRKLKNTKLK